VRVQPRNRGERGGGRDCRRIRGVPQMRVRLSAGCGCSCGVKRGGSIGQIDVDPESVRVLRVLNKVPRRVVSLVARGAREVGGFCNKNKKKKMLETIFHEVMFKAVILLGRTMANIKDHLAWHNILKMVITSDLAIERQKHWLKYS
jgi:hypothetical protein